MSGARHLRLEAPARQPREAHPSAAHQTAPSVIASKMRILSDGSLARNDSSACTSVPAIVKIFANNADHVSICCQFGSSFWSKLGRGLTGWAPPSTMEWSLSQEVTPVLRLHAMYAVLQVDHGGSRKGSERTTA